jgi:biotin carboxylase
MPRVEREFGCKPDHLIEDWRIDCPSEEVEGWSTPSAVIFVGVDAYKGPRVLLSVQSEIGSNIVMMDPEDGSISVMQSALSALNLDQAEALATDLRAAINLLIEKKMEGL